MKINREQNRKDAENLIKMAQARLNKPNIKLVANPNRNGGCEYRALDGKLAKYGENYNKGKNNIWFCYAFELNYQDIKVYNFRVELRKIGFTPYEITGLEDGLLSWNRSQLPAIQELHLDEYHRGKNIGNEIRNLLK